MTTSSKNNELPKLPSWVYIIILTIIFGYIAYSKTVKKEQFETRQTANLAELNIASIPMDNVRSVIIHPHSAYGDEKISCLTKSYQGNFIKLIGKMSQAQYLGMHMNYYRTIDIDAGDAGKYNLEILTRGQDAHAEFTRFGERDPRVEYNAAEVYEWLENLRKSAFQECPTGISK